MNSPTTSLDEIGVGDRVIYASHGLGRVKQRCPGRDGQTEVVVLEFAGGLSVTLPVDRALQYLRAPSSERELGRVQRTLRAPATAGDDSWRLRLKATNEKIAGGSAVALAEVVRDGVRAEPRLSARGDVRQPSLAERQLYLKARQLLADEIAGARGIDPSAADEWISAQLERAPTPLRDTGDEG